MNFVVGLKSGSTVNSSFVVASSWLDCLTYAQGTGKELVSMSCNSNLFLDVIVVDSSTNTSFNIHFVDEITGTKSVLILFHRDISSAISWANSQPNKIFNGIIPQKIEYIVL